MGPPSFKTDLEPIFSNESEPLGIKLWNLNKFTKSAREALESASASEKDDFIASIPHVTFLERKTRLELANVLKRPGPVFDTWKSEDKSLLYYSLHNIHWIFTDSECSPLVSNPDFLVKDLFPTLSHSCRKKVVRQMGKLCPQKDVENITDIYNKLLEIYGIKIAKYLLPACNQTLIDSLVQAKKVKLEHNQLLAVYKKYPETGIKYLQQLYQDLAHSNPTSRRGSNVNVICSNQFFTLKDSCPFTLKLVAKNNPSEFMNLVEKYEPFASVNLGWRLTQHLLKHGKDRIISGNKAAAYAKILCHHAVMRILSAEDYFEFFVKLFPENVGDFLADFEISDHPAPSLFTWLDKYAPELRFEKLDAAFKSCYNNKSILDFPQEMVTSRMLHILGPESRDKWVDYRLSQPDTGTPYLFNDPIFNHPVHLEGYWEAFRTPDKSIPRIKQYLATESDVARRTDLLTSLVNTCAINKDKNALKEVCQFVSSRFRNDNTQVRVEFLRTVSDLFDLLKLDEDHWKPLNELLHISSINNEISWNSHVLERILEKSIHFRAEKDLPVDTQIQHYIKMKSSTFCMGETWCIATSNPVLERKCLKLFTEHLSSMFSLASTYPSDSAITSVIISLFESYSGWNRRRRNSKDYKSNGGKTMDLLTATESSWLMKRLQDVLESYHESNKQRVISALNNDPQAKAALMPRLLKSYPDQSLFLRLLRKEPKKLDELTDEILDFILASTKVVQWGPVLKKFRTSGLPRLAEKFVSKCLQIAEDEEESLKERTNSIYILSFLLDSNKFAAWISKYYPEDVPKFDNYTPEEIGVIYGIRKMIAQSLSNLSIPSAGIPALVHFCKGDYLKLSVGSLYSIVENSPFNQKLVEFLFELANRPVSVKKHAIRLMISISTNEENIKFLKNLWTSEKHHSIRTILFNRIFEFFLQNNSEETWELVKSSVASLSANDHPFLESLGRTGYILSPGMPNEKLSQYLKLALDKISSIATTLPECKWVKVTLLQCIIPTNIKFIEESLIQSIFEQHLFNLKDEADMQSVSVYLSLNYLFHYPNSKVDIVTSYLEKLIGPAWDTSCKDSYTSFPAKQSLSFFVEQLALRSFQTESGHVENLSAEKYVNIFSQIQQYLRTSSRDVSEFFVDDLFLSFSIIFHTHHKSDELDELVTVGKEIGKLADYCVSVYKPEIISVFSEAAKRFISYCCSERLRDRKSNSDSDGARIIFIVEGILESTGSIDTAIIASQLLLSSFGVIQKGHKFEGHFANVMKKLTQIKDKTVQIFVRYGTAQCRPNRGFDILV